MYDDSVTWVTTNYMLHLYYQIKLVGNKKGYIPPQSLKIASFLSFAVYLVLILLL